MDVNHATTLDNLETTILTLARDNILINYIKTKNIINKEKLQLIYLATANSNKNIMQVRFISNIGDEIIRIDKIKGENQSKIIQELQEVNYGLEMNINVNDIIQDKYVELVIDTSSSNFSFGWLL